MIFFRQRIDLHWIALKFKILMTTCPTPLYVCAHTTFSCINYVTISRHRLTCTCTPLWDFSVRVRASPYGIFDRFEDEWSLMGFACRFADEWCLTGFACRFADEWSLMGFHAVSQTSEALWVFIPFRGEWRYLGFSVCFTAMDTFWVLGIIRGV